MQGKLKPQVEALLDLNQAIALQVQNYLRWEHWTPIVGALLLSGIRPSSRWIEIPALEGHQDHEPISNRELFVDLLASTRKSEVGLDKEPVPRDSPRFQNAEKILDFWDQVCSHHNDYPIDLPPRDFALWLMNMHRQGFIQGLLPMWLDAFTNAYDLKHVNKIIPQAVLTFLSGGASKGLVRPSKHKFGREIERARLAALMDGAPTTDPDEVLNRLAEMMKHGEVAGITYHHYANKSDLQYKRSDDRKIHTLRRDSLARQLRRMKESEGKSREISNPVERTTEAGRPVIGRVEVNRDSINRFSSSEQIMSLAQNLLAESTHYVQQVAALRMKGSDWESGIAAIVGNIVRLSKQMIALGCLASAEMGEALVLMMPLTVETIINIKYLITQDSPELLDHYVAHSGQSETADGAEWATLNLQRRAELAGLSHLYASVLSDAPQFLHGSWKDVCRYHLSDAGEGTYLAELNWMKPHPWGLLVISETALGAVLLFLHFFDGLLIDEMRKAIKDLMARLRAASDLLTKHYDARWF